MAQRFILNKNKHLTLKPYKKVALTKEIPTSIVIKEDEYEEQPIVSEEVKKKVVSRVKKKEDVIENDFIDNSIIDENK